MSVLASGLDGFSSLAFGLVSLGVVGAAAGFRVGPFGAGFFFAVVVVMTAA